MKKRILTGLQCTADQFHIGNYFGAVKPMIELSKDSNNEMFLFLANMHSFTTVQNGAELRRNAMNTTKLFYASLEDEDSFFIYNQADVPAHTQLARVFNCLTHLWALERMHWFKDKAAKWKANEASAWLLTYPILMAADILLYDAHFVPVGMDQKQHIELTQEICKKFNNAYWDTFQYPQWLIQKKIATIPWIDGRKMSKSYNNYIWVLDDEKTMLKKIKQIATHTYTVEESKDPDTCNVYNILKLFLDSTEDLAIRKRYTDGWLSYKEVKDYLYEKIVTYFRPLQTKYASLSDEYVINKLAKNAIVANEMANKKIQDVYRKVWFSI